MLRNRRNRVWAFGIAALVVAAPCAWADEGVKFARPQGEPTAPLKLRIIEPTDVVAPPQEKLEPLFFQGVQIGNASQADVQAAWGKPIKSTQHETVTQQTFLVEPFARIEATFFQQQLLSATVHLRQPLPINSVAQQLSLLEIEPIEQRDATGKPIGQTYPERGVTLSFANTRSPGQTQQIVLDCLDALPFLMRAEQNLKHRPSRSLADVETALQLDPQSVRAIRTKATVLSRVGKLRDALQAATAAVQADGENVEARLARAEALAALGEIDTALNEAHSAIERAAGRAEWQARAHRVLGDLLARGPQADFPQALEHHQRAIELADSMTPSDRPHIRRVAVDTLIDAHLSAAQDIAEGDWQNKTASAARWLDRAQLLIRQLHAGAPEALSDATFRLAQRTLSVAAALDSAGDIHPWVERAVDITRARVNASDDEALRASWYWEMGQLLSDAAHIAQRRGDLDKALEYGELATNCLERGRVGRQSPPIEQQFVARAYFRLGSIHAIQGQDHKQAVACFEQARPTIEEPPLAARSRELGLSGEMLVSMGVSYWAVGQQDTAVELTRRGANWIEQAVETRSFSRSALGVPYSNLARMCEYRGQTSEAQKYEQLAQKADSALRR